ncbi:spermine oxidase-like [Mercenaria mercenaria]|uniref:spermine oxidase-like n=1 Tax=Mercenaria mercenaria TaxID=6596 RepID=UPI00234F9B63|nr:spermine oxidase-like [Mercenaria mercenaria]XP_053389190.1 spermine oxidase-like [Mercenaria mercenaria]
MYVRKQPKVVIIGAGIAGISAARRLVDAEFKDVIILEAANRIGGRIHTVKFGDGDMPIEMGANWIHGPTVQNSTFQVAETIGALQPYRINNRMSARFMREDGTEIRREIVKEAVHIYNKVMDDVYRTLPRERIKNSRIVTMAPLIYECLDKEVKKLEQNEDYIEDMKRVLNAMLNYSRFHEGEELEKVTWEKDIEEYNVPDGGDVHIPGGYVQILNHLMKTVPKESLILQTEVVNINWENCENEQLKIKTKNGTTFTADHVIVTSSIGYLKKHCETLFKPLLPEIKIEVLNSMALGRVDKIFLEFDTAVLAPTYSSVAFAWDDTTIGGDSSKWYKRIFGFDQIFTKNKTILGWISGDGAEYMETLSDEEIGKTCVQLLRQFLGNKDIPNAKAVLVSRWCSNPFVLGSYFYQTKTMIPGEQKILSEPLTTTSGKPVVMFAGEALTNCCTHGARDSGIQQAEKVIDLYQGKSLEAKL